MITLNSVCVFCSSDENVAEELKSCSEELGNYLAQKKMTVYTGGSEKGLMRSVANGFIKTGELSKYQMIIPEVFRAKCDDQHPALKPDNILWVDSFRVQLLEFESKAQAFIILPGGYGTILEFFHLLSQKKNSNAATNVILFNYNGFWDHLLKQLDFMVTENVLSSEHRNIFHVVSCVKDLDKFL